MTSEGRPGVGGADEREELGLTPYSNPQAPTPLWGHSSLWGLRGQTWGQGGCPGKGCGRGRAVDPGRGGQLQSRYQQVSGRPPSVRSPVTPALAAPRPLCRLGEEPPPGCLWGQDGCASSSPGCFPSPHPTLPLPATPGLAPRTSPQPPCSLCSAGMRSMTLMKKAKSECAGEGGTQQLLGRSPPAGRGLT